ncbi:capsule biosynthesis protein [Parabacteroides sp. AM58-2XD]|uniref:SLBB domain-containing protein n=1 Tax=Parabacteroides TaxID=375288 RepID=UPI000FE1C445|nr:MULTISPECIES: SLBB domain-containing protein [Parabacteroides]RGY91998.1 capsule biosynthesis protein [Parabacteroides sp. AM58-2XD]GKG74146.1 capsule polysaccharide transporter [Parabacteroides goldsteinii]GKG82447.1 capsule polysaccharide transporter [Parabacteroides goldsteinii]
MNIVIRNVLLGGLLWLAVPLSAQVPQDLIDKAKAAGMTDDQIRREMNKRMGQSGTEQATRTASDAVVTDRTVTVPDGKEIPPLDAQRETNRPTGDLSGTVFGREIFSNKNLSFEPDLNVPTPKGYVLSAGDELLINVWGDSELNLKLKVSPEGTILIPNLGPVSVSGLTIETAENRIRQELGRIMSTLSGNTDGANTFVSVSLSQIRSIKVNIVGEVVAPGTYTLPSFATLFNALYAAGGVNEIGSLRGIKVYRNSKEVAKLDVYDYLLNGKYNTNIRLEENDMVIVSPYDQLAVVRGKVKRNRIFEMKKGETLQQLLNMAGGFTGDAYKKDVCIKRKADSRYQIATVTEDKYPTFAMMDGDSLLVDSVIPFYENRLIVTGAVWRPGEYELNGTVHTVKGLINQAAGLKGDEFTGRAQITRLNPDFTTTVIAVDIRGILNGTSPDIELKPEDILNIPSLFDLREPYTIKISGAVNYVDTVLPYRNNLTVEDAIMMAGGLKESAATVNVEVARRIKDTKTYENSNRTAEVFNFELNDNLGLISVDGKNSNSVFTLEPFDEVYVRFSPGYQEQQVVKVDGEITFSGDYVLAEKNSRLSNIIAKAGGITPDAYVKGASLKRQLTEDEMRRLETLLQLSSNKQSRDSVALSLENIKNYSVGIDLEKALANPGSAHDVVLRDGDELYIPQLQSTVKINGAVTYPNSVTYTKGMSVGNCLSQAGGYNDIARKYPIVIYMNGKVATTKKCFIFFKRYPKVEPGCEIVVPTKTQRDRKTSLAEVLSIASSTTSMAAMVTSIINTLK